jgi:hypothetical protein
MQRALCPGSRDRRHGEWPHGGGRRAGADAGRCPAADAAASKQGSQLAASFSVVLPKTIQELAAGPFPIILAVGPLAADGSLLPHAGSTSRFPYGGAELTLPGASAG